MLVFGEWVRRKRKERNYTLEVLAEKVGVDAATISRLENQMSDVTLRTASRICIGLGLHLSAFAREWYKKTTAANREIYRPYVWETLYPGYDPATINSSEISNFLHLYLEDTSNTKELLLNSLNRAAQRTHKKGSDSNSTFTLVDIERFLEPSTLYHFELKYPPSELGDTVKYIYWNGGTITQSDYEIYIRSVRGIASKNRVLNRKSKGLLDRLQIGFDDRVQMLDLIYLDDRLGEDVLGVYWSMVNFGQLPPLGYFDKAHGLLMTPTLAAIVKLLVTIDRWLRHFDNEYQEWLDELRKKIGTTK